MLAKLLVPGKSTVALCIGLAFLLVIVAVFQFLYQPVYGVVLLFSSFLLGLIPVWVSVKKQKAVTPEKAILMAMEEKHGPITAPEILQKVEPEERDVTKPDTKPDENKKLSLYLKQGEEYLKSGDFVTAVNLLSAALKLDDENITAYYFRGLAYKYLGVKKDSLNDLRQAAKRGCERSIKLLQSERRIS